MRLRSGRVAGWKEEGITMYCHKCNGRFHWSKLRVQGSDHFCARCFETPKEERDCYGCGSKVLAEKMILHRTVPYCPHCYDRNVARPHLFHHLQNSIAVCEPTKSESEKYLSLNKWDQDFVSKMEKEEKSVAPVVKKYDNQHIYLPVETLDKPDTSTGVPITYECNTTPYKPFIDLPVVKPVEPGTFNLMLEGNEWIPWKGP